MKKELNRSYSYGELEGELFFFIELKDRPSQKTLRIIKEAFKGRERDLRIISFKSKYLNIVKAFNPQFKTLKVSLLKPFLMMDRLEDGGFKYDGYSLLYSKRNLKFLKKANRYNIESSVWTVNDRLGMERSFNKDIKFITTNFPATCWEIKNFIVR